MHYAFTNGSLDALIDRAVGRDLLDSCVKNDWQVTFRVGTNSFTLNHAAALVFLQGLLVGAGRRDARPAPAPVAGSPLPLSHGMVDGLMPSVG